MTAELPVNKILHGECVELMDSLPEKIFDLVFADPPYNLQLAGDLWRPNMTKVDAVDDHWDQFDSFAEYDDFTRRWLASARRVLKDTGTIWIIGSYHNIYRVGAILMDLGYWILNDVVWVKTNPMPQMKGVRFCNAHETLLWAKKSQEQKSHTFHYKEMKAANEDLQMRSDWYISICSGGERLTTNGTKTHTTQKPEALLRRILSATSNPGDLVFDPFCGTGTTAAVAAKLGRDFITIDKEEEYVRAARQRLAAVVPDMMPEESDLIDAPKPRIAFATLVEQGVLKAGDKLYLKGSRDKTAVIQSDGTLVANGLKGSIHKIGALLQNQPACNGWSDWYFEDKHSGRLILLDTLRPAAR